MSGLDETIHLSEYDPQWKELFVMESQRISRCVPSGVKIEHIGSTAVPQLLAKPIIDIMLGTEPHQKCEVRASLLGLGYEDMEEAGVPGRIYLRKRIDGDFNVALVTRGGPLWVTNLALRDHLRTSPDARQEYTRIKREAINTGIGSLLAYSDYKSAVVSRLIADALERQRP